MRGRPLSKQTSKWAECVCVTLTAIISLAGTAGIAVQICINHITTGVIQGTIAMFVLSGVDLEVVLVSLSLCLAFCVIRKRIRIRQTAVLLRNSVCHVSVNAVVMGVDAMGTGYDIYMWSTHKIYNSRIFFWYNCCFNMGSFFLCW